MTILTGRIEHGMPHRLRRAPHAAAGLAALLLLSALMPGTADAATATMTMPVTVTITAGFTTALGNTIGTSQTITVCGQVPAQSSPAPGSHGDVVNVHHRILRRA